MFDPEEHEPDASRFRETSARIAYVRPTLKVYGDIALVTQTVGMNGKVADGGPGNGMSKTS